MHIEKPRKFAKLYFLLLFVIAIATISSCDNNLMIIASDHGQGMGENDQFGHGALLWESILRVPLLIVYFRTPKQAIVDQRVGVVDLSPTMLQAAKIKILGNMFGRALYPLDKPLNGKDRLYYSKVKLTENPSEVYAPLVRPYRSCNIHG
ncbi:MAG: sulfatase-like hydrolase/transferase [Xanthomonadales bacterium]|nr:sulfatase-like hydrolase/transferase [Xanthomonadales bacterium]